jgi:glycosyltransferase involved in cell wall biosynthesis
MEGLFAMSESAASATPAGSRAKGGVDVSVVVTTRNEEKYLPVLLDSLRTQGCDLDAEIIVVDDGSTDRSIALAERAGARVLPSRERGDVPGMRNQGLAEARGSAVLFADADVAFSPDYLAAMATPIVRGEVDVTLCMRQRPLEARFSVLPDRYSPSYAWVVRHLPAWCLTKLPMRLFPWLGAWLAAMARRRRLVSLLAIPDRVNTPAIVVRSEVARLAGGWRDRFGTHEDTLYCRNVFACTERVRWRLRPILYVSGRRRFPTDGWWPLRLAVGSLAELVGAGRWVERSVQDELGYKDPEGRR